MRNAIVSQSALARHLAVPRPALVGALGVALFFLIVLMAIPSTRVGLARHPFDVAAFVVIVGGMAWFWGSGMDLSRRLRRNLVSVIGFLIIGAFAFVATLAPVLAPPTPNTRDPYLVPHEGFAPDPRPPRPGHPLGTTANQYDLYYGIVWGTRTAFRIGLAVVAISIAIGLVLGSIAGFYGGRIDEAIMRITDIFLAFPGLVLAVVVVSVLGKGLDKVMIAIALVNWPSYARLLRGDILSVRQRDFVEAARAVGSGDFRIIFRHVVPNAIYPFMVVAAFDMGTIVLVAAALSFLGLGAEVGYADWGQFINMSRSFILGIPGNPFIYWYTLVFPGLVIFLFVLAWNLLGDAFRDILDPRLRGSS